MIQEMILLSGKRKTMGGRLKEKRISSGIFVLNSKGRLPVPIDSEIDILNAAKELDLPFGSNWFSLEKPNFESGFYDLRFSLADSKVRVYSNGSFTITNLKSESHKFFVEKKLFLVWENFLVKYLKKKAIQK